MYPSDKYFEPIHVNLGEIRKINYIQFVLKADDERSYSYYIDVSLDGAEYKRLIDHTKYYCRSLQFLHFPWHRIQYIKLYGTNVINIPDNYKRNIRIQHHRVGVTIIEVRDTFEVANIEAMYIKRRDTPNDFLRPTNNVADVDLGAIVLEGHGDTDGMLVENMAEYTYHKKDGQILLQLNQPYYISSVRMLLGSNMSYSNEYSFYIQTSLDNENWQMAVDKHDETLSGWQQFVFDERLVTFVKIIGTNDVSSFFVNLKIMVCNGKWYLF